MNHGVMIKQQVIPYVWMKWFIEWSLTGWQIATYVDILFEKSLWFTDFFINFVWMKNII